MTDIVRLRAFERAKRITMLGMLVTVATAVWLLFAWRASRIAETDCTVIAMPGTTYCALSHGDHQTAWRTCESPTESGSHLRCFYYLNDPDNIFVAPRRHDWLSPLAVGVLVLALVSFGYGLTRLALVRVTHEPPRGGPYRTAPPRDVRAPLRVQLRDRAAAELVFGVIFAVLGFVLLVLGTWLAWGHGGEFGVGFLVLGLFSNTVLAVGALAIFYRSGLVFDPNRSLADHWRGLLVPWFHRYRSLDELTHARVFSTPQGRARVHYLALDFSDGTVDRFARSSEDEAREAAERIQGYLRERENHRGRAVRL